ncbi:unnamed protein product [Trichogramma brassicae]|uniref:Uncharacterized protein n=1 Tax=Trichogramma brassicae TaxID=86971 RepID=A0A6H5IEW2_9HYME|nr:unnamed protein product [Trichogramma brassicae]
MAHVGQDPRNNASIHRGCTNCCASSTTRLYSMADHDDKFVTRVRKRSCEIIAMIQQIDVQQQQQQQGSITATTSLDVVVE